LLNVFTSCDNHGIYCTNVKNCGITVGTVKKMPAIPGDWKTRAITAAVVVITW